MAVLLPREAACNAKKLECETFALYLCLLCQRYWDCSHCRKALTRQGALRQQGARRQKCGSSPLHNNPFRYLCLAETAPPSTCNTFSDSPRKCRVPGSNTGRARTKAGGTRGQL